MFKALKAAEHLSEPEDFPNEKFAIHAVNTVLNRLLHYVSPGEMKDVLSQLPQQVRSLMKLDDVG